MPLFTRCNISLRFPHNVSVKFQLKKPTDHLFYHFENAYFEWKQKQAVFVHVSLNANVLLFPTPFSRIGLTWMLYREDKRIVWGSLRAGSANTAVSVKSRGRGL